MHTHTGSQGVPLALMAEGVGEAYALAEEINRAAGRQQVDALDIGGGLPVNFASDEETPTYAEYARLLAGTVPGLFDGRYRLVTEFGRSLLAKHGTVLARVEYTKTSGGRPIAVTHAGVQLATRTVYAPGSWPLRVLAYDSGGRPRTGETAVQDVAGPACFAGDLLATGRELPLLRPGDVVAVPDTGAYYFAHHYAYNSLPRPGIHGFAVAGDRTVAFTPVRRPQTLDEIVAEAGGELADALVDPPAGPAGREGRTEEGRQSGSAAPRPGFHGDMSGEDMTGTGTDGTAVVVERRVAASPGGSGRRSPTCRGCRAS